MPITLPPTIQRLTEGLPYQTDSVGHSGHAVLLYPDRVLKIGPIAPETINELAMLRFLAGRLPVPEVLGYEEVDGTRYLLTTRIPGAMLCDNDLMQDLHRVADLLSEALHLLWAADPAGCPGDMRLERKFTAIEDTLRRGEIDLTYAEPDTFGPGGFSGPEELLRWLRDNRPAEHPHVSHGDCCLPNILTQGGRISGFIDLGRAGLADPWYDIALCYRSFWHNCNGHHAYHPGWTKELLFDALGIRPDWELIRYYMLLDELF